ncbi:MAG: hypothetical protein KIC65_09585 [Firmicutes bacterium]|nr:hypothetical protein [Bacillota bacterium]
MNDIIVEKIELMCHALGIESRNFRKGQTRHVCYRNYFIVSKPDELWEDIVNDGYANKLIENNSIIYSVNKAGMILLGRIYDLHFTERI